MNQLAQDLRAAKAGIDTPQTWGVCSMDSCPDATGHDCMWVSMNNAAGGDMKRTNAMVFALGFPNRKAVFDWNDAPERTHAEVMAAFDKAIAAAEAQP